MLRTSRSDRRAAVALEPRQVLYWIYAGRLVISLAVFGSAAVIGDFLAVRAPGVMAPETRLLGILGLAAAAILTPLAYGRSHRRRRKLTRGFLYSQAALDVALFNAIVHITGGSQSPFVSLFIALAAGYALILPFPSPVNVALATGLVYLLDNLVFYPDRISEVGLLLQVVVITVVALATSLIGSRLRQVRRDLRTVEGELDRLRLDTADILRAIPSGVVTLDGSGNLAYLNLAAAELLAIRVPDLLGRNLLPELTRRAPEIAAAVRETMETGRRIHDREAEVFPNPEAAESVPVDGEDGPVPVSVSTTVLQDSGAGRSSVVLLQDLRAVRQLEDLRLRTGRLEAVAELSASLAHELRNPLASIRSAVEQLCGRARDDDDDRILGRLIVRESDRMGRILAEFSDFARVNVAERRPVDVEKLLRDVVETARRHPVAEGRATLDVDIRSDMRGLWGDPELLHRTLLNLVLNALQVGDPSSPISVRVVADALRPDLVPRQVSLGNPVRIRVIDDGPGIAAEDLPRVFDPFFTRREGGSGLGLSIAHRAVQAHGGALVATSAAGRGATFAVVLPRRAFGGSQQWYRDQRSAPDSETLREAAVAAARDEAAAERSR